MKVVEIIAHAPIEYFSAIKWISLKNNVTAEWC